MGVGVICLWKEALNQDRTVGLVEYSQYGLRTVYVSTRREQTSEQSGQLHCQAMTVQLIAMVTVKCAIKSIPTTNVVAPAI